MVAITFQKRVVSANARKAAHQAKNADPLSEIALRAQLQRLNDKRSLNTPLFSLLASQQGQALSALVENHSMEAVPDSGPPLWGRISSGLRCLPRWISIVEVEMIGLSL
jgi:hypothetical protein